MNHSDLEASVALHYTPNGLYDRILSNLGLVDAPNETVSVETLFPIDQLHHGGLALTGHMAVVAQVTAGQSVLDAGSGIGGAARFLAHKFGCEVAALDLSEEFVQTARALDRLVGLNNAIDNRCGSVLELPYEESSFDAVWSQNVTMNVQNKAAMFAEAFRVLRPGGRYVITHMATGTAEALSFPVPWAMAAETSFTTAPTVMFATLNKAGFTQVQDHMKTISLPPPPKGNGGPDDSLAMGPDMPLRRANAGAAVADGRLMPMLITAQRPHTG